MAVSTCSMGRSSVLPPIFVSATLRCAVIVEVSLTVHPFSSASVHSEGYSFLFVILCFFIPVLPTTARVPNLDCGLDIIGNHGYRRRNCLISPFWNAPILTLCLSFVDIVDNCCFMTKKNVTRYSTIPITQHPETYSFKSQRWRTFVSTCCP